VTYQEHDNRERLEVTCAGRYVRIGTVGLNLEESRAGEIQRELVGVIRAAEERAYQAGLEHVRSHLRAALGHADD
jgi:hypothetical protein